MYIDATSGRGILNDWDMATNEHGKRPRERTISPNFFGHAMPDLAFIFYRTWEFRLFLLPDPDQPLSFQDGIWSFALVSIPRSAVHRVQQGLPTLLDILISLRSTISRRG
ncbi:hypothetical protein Hypma_014865 [Hypsizygus marmoreus]|uniref:Uncharacterized protein n=1 Tax=Hypsizygus marmoreus TaxID=39966 RepID=A0A369K9Z6_HYPMA|nr:hypothetical protein Hypma_014865 [Hypsizygus marmoreus]